MKTTRIARVAALACLIGFVAAIARTEQVGNAIRRAVGESVEEAGDDLARALEPPPSLTPDHGVFMLGDAELAGERDGWSAIPEQPPTRIVLLVHGLDEPGSIWKQLAPALDERGLHVARFEYPNDQAIAASGDAFIAELTRLHDLGIEHVDLVAHSMGGLVCRDALTREGDAARPAVGRLIMVGTPHLGSAMAPLRGFAEAREQWARWRKADSWDPRPLFDATGDGSGQAGEDLRPGSEYLAELNARQLPTDVEITIIAGVIEGLDEEDLSTIRRLFGRGQAEQLRSAINRKLAQVGDGVVSRESAMLEGVEDTHVVKATHRGLLATIRAEQVARGALTADGRQAVPPAIPLIIERLAPEGRATEGVDPD